MNHEPVAILTMMIPIVGIIMGVGVAMLGVFLEFRRKSEVVKLYHTERMAAIEKGIELPPLPAELLQSSRRRVPDPARHRRSGLVLLFLGLAITGAMWGTGIPAYWWGLVPAAVGLALLVSSALEAKERKGWLAVEAAPRSDP